MSARPDVSLRCIGLICVYLSIVFETAEGGSYLILSDSVHKNYAAAEEACTDQYDGHLTSISDLSADQYLSLLDHVGYYRRFWVFWETSDSLEYNVCRKPYVSGFTSDIVRLECRLFRGNSNSKYPYLCTTDRRPPDDDFGTIYWREYVTHAPISTTEPTPEITPEPETTPSNSNTSEVQIGVKSEKQSGSGHVVGAVLGVIFGLLVSATIVIMVYIWTKRRDVWDKYWCLTNKKETPGGQNVYDSANHTADAEAHTYCDLQRSETGQTYLASEESAYYSEPNAVNPHPAPSGGLNSPTVENIHYIVMDTSNSNVIGNHNAYSVGVIDHSGNFVSNENNYEGQTSAIDRNTDSCADSKVKCQGQGIVDNGGSSTALFSSEPFYDLARPSAPVNGNNSNPSTNNGNGIDNIDSQPVYEFAKSV